MEEGFGCDLNDLNNKQDLNIRQGPERFWEGYITKGEKWAGFGES